MLDEKVAQLINTQINKEFYSAYLYLGFSTWFSDQGLEGFANWYQIQAQEERDHAMLFLEYLQNNGGRPVLEAIDRPDQDFSGAREVLAAGEKHEHYVTGLINTIYAAAAEQKDFRTMQFLDWFVKEQGEEEKNAGDLLKKWDLFGADPRALYMLDNEMSSRTYSAPSLTL
ncbi:MAG: ferritin [Oscillospiraceae bacterium]|nr:ferritin [Oscillospiraceae bacterium]